MGHLDLRIADKYQLLQRIGGGSFGVVYKGINIDTGENVAIKLEHVSIDPSLLKGEVEIYQSLSDGTGIPRFYAYHTECEYNAMVFELLGPSLEDLFNYCGRQFSLKTVLMLANQLLYLLEYIHSKSVVHRDIKPENFLMGVGKHGNQVYVTDLGLATEGHDAQVKANTGCAHNARLIGTARYASVNGHLGIVTHRCDDLESLGYMLLYFLQGSLPWQGLEAVDKTAKEELILKKKQTTSTNDLCKGLPTEFAAYFDHIHSSRCGDAPKYSYLCRIFYDLFKRSGFDYDYVDVREWGYRNRTEPFYDKVLL